MGALPHGIGVVFPFPTEAAWRTIIQIVKATAGIKPVTKRNDEGVMRARYAPAVTKTILNFSSPQILARLGNPQAVMTLEVEDTHDAAALAADIFADAGYGSRIIDALDVEIGIPAGFMHFVLTDDFPPILFWPKNPDPELLEQMVPPEEWTD